MKYVEVVTESRIRTISLVLLLIFMSLGWYLDSSFGTRQSSWLSQLHLSYIVYIII